MALDPSIALQVKQPDMMGSIGNMLNIANASNQYQSGQQSIESQNIALQSQRQLNAERQNIIQLMQKDPSLQPKPDGTFDIKVTKTV